MTLILFASLFACHSALAFAYREGEFIPTARKSQYDEVRTEWHDLLGRHCPRFGQDRMVALPLPKPSQVGTHSKYQYKIQLSFDGDRLVTPWLKVFETAKPGKVPVVKVVLRRAGEELLGVSAKVVDAPLAYQHTHANLVDEYKDVDRWPKHLLIQYRFVSELEVDLDRGLYVIIPLCILALLVLLVSAASGSKAKLAQFLTEIAAVAADEGVSAPVTWKEEGAKGE